MRPNIKISNNSSIPALFAFALFPLIIEKRFGKDRVGKLKHLHFMSDVLNFGMRAFCLVPDVIVDSLGVIGFEDGFGDGDIFGVAVVFDGSEEVGYPGGLLFGWGSV